MSTPLARSRRAASSALMALIALVGLAACGSDGTADMGAPTTAPTAVEPHTPTTTTSPPDARAPAPVEVTPPPPPVGRPAWLGTRPLPLRPDGYGEIQPTPPELDDRRLPTIDVLPPPPDDAFTATVAPVPADVADRATWTPACPVGLDELRYVTVAFWGFDGRPHTGELLVHGSAADGIVEVFRRLHDARFPIEEMRVASPADLDAPPTGDGNGTGSFVCRGSRGAGSSWSEHAYGLAVDINPFHNPYVKGDVVLPELASSYVDRNRDRPGMIQPGDVVTTAFGSIGWSWGGAWSSAKDYMHFSARGR